MPRPVRQVALSPQKQAAPIQSPTRKLNRPRNTRPRDSDVSSVASQDEEISVASPYTPRPQESQQSITSKKGKILNAKASLQRQALQNARRSISGTHTPRQVPIRDESSVPSDLHVVGTAITPASKRPMPILSNFEDWLKLATDNKINATNSWNFALIDYFHEMSLLKDESGKGINFQKASHTLDGCVKVYVGRVDSVGVEAGRLLSGLASSASEEEIAKKKKRRGDDEENEDDEDGEGEESDGEGGTKKKEKKRKQRSHEATLAPSLASLQLRKLDLEFGVDPLFKKASADFDEGGAKGLLLNHLCINEEGRIVFDSSDDAQEGKKEDSEHTPEEMSQKMQTDSTQDAAELSSSRSQHQKDQPDQVEELEIDLNALASKFFPELSLLDNLDICPSMKDFKLGDPTAALNMPPLKGDSWKDKKPNPEQRPPPQIGGDLDLADQSGLFLDGSNGLDFDDDDGFGGFDIGEEVGFGQGGEAWAKEAAVEPMLRPVAMDEDGEQIEDEADGYAVSMEHRYREDADQETMLAFFGKVFNSKAKVGTRAFETITNWRIQKIQKSAQAESTPAVRQRKEKEPFEIDFHGPRSDNLKKLLAEKPIANDKISLPRTQLKTKGRNLIDKDDEMIDVKSMMRLWTKPKCRVSRRKGGMTVIDEGFGARGQQQAKPNERLDDDEEDAPQGDYDANFFADDGPIGLPFDGPLPIDDDDDDDGDQPGFVDAREMLSPPPDGQLQQNLDEMLQGMDQPPDLEGLFPSASQPELLPGSFGSQLVTQQGRRMRPEYVNYARTAKKVDVRALKENMWRGMIPRLNAFSAPEPQRESTPPLTDDDGDTDMVEAEAHDVRNDEPIELKEGESLRFTNILTGLKTVYPDEQMRDISTSYGFICLLHLANEKGLLLEGGREEGTMNEIMVRRDPGVEEGYVGE